MAAVTDCHKPGGLQKWKFILSPCLRPEVQNEDVSRATLPPKALGEDTFLSLPASGSFRHDLAFLATQLESLLVFIWLCHFFLQSSTLVIDFRVDPDNLGLSHLKVLNYMCQNAFSK